MISRALADIVKNRPLIFAFMGMFIYFLSIPNEAIAATDCPRPPPVQYSLKAEPRYGKSQIGKEVVDEKAIAYNAKSLADLRKFHSLISRLSDEAIQQKPYAAECLAALFDNWANGDALLGSANTNQAKYERLWALSGIALSAFKLQQSGHSLSPTTLNWLEKLAEQVYSEQKHRRVANNLAVWAALGTATVALLTDRDDLWEWSKNRVHLFLAQVEPDGSMPTELARGKRATRYHFYAGQPLLAFNRIARCYGSPFDSQDQRSFDSFVALLQNLKSGKVSLTAKVGIEQLPPIKYAWLPTILGEKPASNKRQNDARIPQLGGSIAMLYKATQCSKP